MQELSKPIEDKVKFVGSLPHKRLAAYYSSCDIFVHPSVWNEPFGMILTEAMSCERPVISTYAGGIPEIVVHDRTGLLVKPDDTQALADAILQLLNSEKQRGEMGKEGKKRVENKFSWHKTTEVFLEVLEQTKMKQ